MTRRKFWDIRMQDERKYYQIIAITTGLLLFGSAFTGFAPMVFADDNDRNEKIKKLKDLINKWKKDKKCPDKKKYEGKCDKQKPKLKITSPKNKQKVPGTEIMITGTASDKISGIDEVLVKIDRHSFQKANYDKNSGTWKITKDLNNGWHIAIAKAVDNVGNVKRDFVFFKVV